MFSLLLNLDVQDEPQFHTAAPLSSTTEMAIETINFIHGKLLLIHKTALCQKRSQYLKRILRITSSE